MPLYRLHSVASFFPHFQLTPPKPVTLRICRDMACHMAGSGKMLRELHASGGGMSAVEGVSCLGRCDRAPAACVPSPERSTNIITSARSAAELKQIAEDWLRGEPRPADHDADQPFSPAPSTIDPYAGERRRTARCCGRSRFAIEALDKAAPRSRRSSAGRRMRSRDSATARSTRAARHDFAGCRRSGARWQTEDDWAKGPELAGWSEALLDELKEADLRGMGGAGIPAAQKWRDVRDAVRTAFARQGRHRAFIVVNGDESEPGTFKDRELLLRTPHLVVEGVILAGLITEATEGFIYIRHEYPEQIAACRAEIARAEQLGVCGPNASLLGRPFPVSVFVSPGGYICGEQSALIEAMSDRRGEPRNMPPKLETNGLDDLPTLVSNVETFAWVPYIALNGGAAMPRRA